uniref:Uncharacterized protein n=1 Tax=Phenylobacterium glaciei TaxID=2803784 RepID=A0A974S976_9CAUL|nr:hypothetical protein JKL49_01450 [Phenylobacterium glaciei]
MAPLMQDGRRWPQPKPAPRTVWRLQVSYWRLGSAVKAADGPRPATPGARPATPWTIRP